MFHRFQRELGTFIGPRRSVRCGREEVVAESSLVENGVPRGKHLCFVVGLPVEVFTVRAEEKLFAFLTVTETRDLEVG